MFRLNMCYKNVMKIYADKVTVTCCVCIFQHLFLLQHCRKASRSTNDVHSGTKTRSSITQNWNPSRWCWYLLGIQWRWLKMKDSNTWFQKWTPKFSLPGISTSLNLWRPVHVAYSYYESTALHIQYWMAGLVFAKVWFMYWEKDIRPYLL